jgi:hypothetical protein
MLTWSQYYFKKKKNRLKKGNFFGKELKYGNLEQGKLRVAIKTTEIHTINRYLLCD